MYQRLLQTHRRVTYDLGSRTLPQLLRDFPTPDTAQLEDDYLAKVSPHEVIVRRAASKPAHAPIHRITYDPDTHTIHLRGYYSRSGASLFLYATLPLWAMVFNRRWSWTMLGVSVIMAVVLAVFQWLALLDATLSLRREIRIRLPHLPAD